MQEYVNVYLLFIIHVLLKYHIYIIIYIYIATHYRKINTELHFFMFMNSICTIHTLLLFNPDSQA